MGLVGMAISIGASTMLPDVVYTAKGATSRGFSAYIEPLNQVGSRIQNYRSLVSFLLQCLILRADRC